jgi:hypothetical protein
MASPPAAHSCLIGGDGDGAPNLKYSPLPGDVDRILVRSSATRLCVSDKILALGTSDGSVHLLDYEGNEASGTCCRGSVAFAIGCPRHPRSSQPAVLQVKHYRHHSAPIQDLSFDAEAEHLASCSADGTVAVRPQQLRRLWQTLSRAGLCPAAVATPLQPSGLQVCGLYSDTLHKMDLHCPLTVRRRPLPPDMVPPTAAHARGRQLAALVAQHAVPAHSTLCVHPPCSLLADDCVGPSVWRAQDTGARLRHRLRHPVPELSGARRPPLAGRHPATGRPPPPGLAGHCGTRVSSCCGAPPLLPPACSPAAAGAAPGAGRQA